MSQTQDTLLNKDSGIRKKRTEDTLFEKQTGIEENVYLSK